MGHGNFLDRFFPAKYDFFKMLGDQASETQAVADALDNWLEGTADHEETLKEASARADAVRRELEKNLVRAFSTPFDRGDIYSISVTMQKTIDYAASTLISMKAFGVRPDPTIRGMSERLRRGAGIFAQAVGLLKNAPAEAEKLIPDIRQTHAEIEQLYRDGMSAAFSGGDAMNALRHREVYHHLKDSSSYLENAVDLLHRIIVRLT